MTRLHAARADETPEVFSIDGQTARDTTRKTNEPNDDRLTTDPEPQQIRGTSQGFEQFSNGDVQIEMNPPRKDGGPEGGSVSQFHHTATAAQLDTSHRWPSAAAVRPEIIGRVAVRCLFAML